MKNIVQAFRLQTFRLVDDAEESARFRAAGKVKDKKTITNVQRGDMHQESLIKKELLNNTGRAQFTHFQVHKIQAGKCARQ